MVNQVILTATDNSVVNNTLVLGNDSTITKVEHVRQYIAGSKNLHTYKFPVVNITKNGQFISGGTSLQTIAVDGVVRLEYYAKNGSS